jgi:hypothetical protein
VAAFGGIVVHEYILLLNPVLSFFLPGWSVLAGAGSSGHEREPGLEGAVLRPLRAWFESAVTLETPEPIKIQWVKSGSFCNALRRKRYDLSLQRLTNQPGFLIFIELFPFTNTTHSSNGVIQ